MSSENTPVVVILVTKRNPVVRLGRPQKYRWTALNWNNRRKLARSSEAYTNVADCISAAVELFGDASVQENLLDAAGFTKTAQGDFWTYDFVPANVYLVRDGVSGMQALRLQSPANP